MLTQRENAFIRGRERDVLKSVRMPESLHRRLKYFALCQGRTETDIVVELVRRELDGLKVQLPPDMA